MKIFVKSSFAILVVTICLNFDQTTGRKTVFSDGKNRLSFEKIICKNYTGSKAVINRCIVKLIDRNNLKIDGLATLSKPVNDVWFNAVGYYKYNTYTKIATELWENACDLIANFMNGKNFLFFPRYLIPFVTNYTNVNHQCPFDGQMWIRADNISIQSFALPQIVPAGRYRLDISITEGLREKVLGSAQIYGSVSDHRVEVV